MLLFLSGRDSKSVGKMLKDSLESRGYSREVYLLDKADAKADRYSISFMGMMSTNFGSDFNDKPLVIFTADDLWFLSDRIGYSLELLFETMGGVLLTQRNDLYQTINDREKLPSYQKESYMSFPMDDMEKFTDFVLSFIEYGAMRGHEICQISNGGYYGEVMGSPRTIFVSENPHDDSDLKNDIEFVTRLRPYLIPEHGNHIGITSLDSVTDIQHVAPFSGYVAIGSSAYNFMGKYMDEDIVKAGIPNPRGIKSWDNETDILKRFARLTSNVVESGERRTSLLHL